MWSHTVNAVTHLALALLPVVVDGPGNYRTRGGKIVRIHCVRERGLFRCEGVHDCGTRDQWSASGRLFPGMLSDHDLVQKLSA